MSYEVKIGSSIGNISLGMSREDVKKVVSGFEEWKDIPYGYTKEVIYDCNEDFQVMYDDDMRVCFILCTTPELLNIEGKTLNTEISYEDVLEKIKGIDQSIDEDGEGFVSNQLGFGLNYDYDDEEHKYITCLQIAIKDFWLNEPYGE